jgi:hypothetical protein
MTEVPPNFITIIANPSTPVVTAASDVCTHGEGPQALYRQPHADQRESPKPLSIRLAEEEVYDAEPEDQHGEQSAKYGSHCISFIPG